MDATALERDLKFTDRGFKHFEPVAGSRADSVQLYESSAAEAPHLWFKAISRSDPNDTNSEPLEAIVHLPIEQAQLLRDQLSYLLENHYQGAAPNHR